jgi:DNA-binding transcriptional MerR regulator
MDVTQPNLDNSDILAATGVSATTIQTWANRGILALSEAQRNPGPGQKRLYSRLDAARIVVIQSLTTEHKLSTNAAGQIASRLERGPLGTIWREATERVAGHIHLFINDGDVVNIYVGNDIQQLAQLLTITNESTEAGVIGRGIQQVTQMKMNIAMYDVGPRVSSALRGIAERRGSFVARAQIALVDSGLSNQFVLKNDEGRFIWCGPIAEPPHAATSGETAWKELENWANKFTVTVQQL